jgi:cysteine desulfurase
MKVIPVYLDYNATTPVDPAVFEEMKPFLTNNFGNASSRHSFGYTSESAVKLGRKRIADLINASPEEIIFTSGATESINIIHFGVAKAYAGKGKHIISTEIEHPAVMESLKYLEQNGYSLSLLKVNSEGLIDLKELSNSVRKETILVSIMAANNEIGTLNDISEIGRICNEKGILFHTDASQAMGKIPLDVNEMNIDLLSFSGHKFYAPKGTGGFFIKKKSPKIRLAPLYFGGGQEKGMRPGTLNVAGIAGLGKAAEICSENLDNEMIKTKDLRDLLLNQLKEKIEDLQLNGSYEKRLPNNININIRGVKSANLIMELRDIAFSSGSACSSESERPSYVLKAIGLDDQSSFCSVRFSIGRFTTSEEIIYAVNKITEAVNKIRNYSQNLVS